MEYTEIGHRTKDGYLCVREGRKICYSIDGTLCAYYKDYDNCIETPCLRKDGESVCFIKTETQNEDIPVGSYDIDGNVCVLANGCRSVDGRICVYAYYDDWYEQCCKMKHILCSSTSRKDRESVCFI